MRDSSAQPDAETNLDPTAASAGRQLSRRRGDISGERREAVLPGRGAPVVAGREVDRLRGVFPNAGHIR